MLKTIERSQIGIGTWNQSFSASAVVRRGDVTVVSVRRNPCGQRETRVRKCEWSTRNGKSHQEGLTVLLRRLFVSWKDLSRPNCYPCRQFVVQSRQGWRKGVLEQSGCRG